MIILFGPVGTVPKAGPRNESPSRLELQLGPELATSPGRHRPGRHFNCSSNHFATSRSSVSSALRLTFLRSALPSADAPAARHSTFPAGPFDTPAIEAVDGAFNADRALADRRQRHWNVARRRQHIWDHAVARRVDKWRIHDRAIAEQRTTADDGAKVGLRELRRGQHRQQPAQRFRLLRKSIDVEGHGDVQFRSVDRRGSRRRPASCRMARSAALCPAPRGGASPAGGPRAGTRRAIDPAYAPKRPRCRRAVAPAFPARRRLARPANVEQADRHAPGHQFRDRRRSLWEGRCLPSWQTANTIGKPAGVRPPESAEGSERDVAPRLQDHLLNPAAVETLSLLALECRPGSLVRFVGQQADPFESCAAMELPLFSGGRIIGFPLPGAMGSRPRRQSPRREVSARAGRGRRASSNATPRRGADPCFPPP